MTTKKDNKTKGSDHVGMTELESFFTDEEEAEFAAEQAIEHTTETQMRIDDYPDEVWDWMYRQSQVLHPDDEEQIIMEMEEEAKRK